MAPLKRRISDSLKVTQLSVAEPCLGPIATQDQLTGWGAGFSLGPVASADTAAPEGKVHNSSAPQANLSWTGVRVAECTPGSDH